MLMSDQLAETRTTGAVNAIATDIAIVGGGLAGSLAAAVLGRAGHRVILVDKRAVYPEEFRVEKIAGQQLDILRRLGFLRELAAVACSYDHVLNIKEGKVVDVSVGQAYGFSYDRLVAMARGLIPDASHFIVDQVTGLTCSEDVQHLSLASGKRIEARLVILATGMAGALGHPLGMTRRGLAAPHSGSFRLPPPPPGKSPVEVC